MRFVGQRRLCKQTKICLDSVLYRSLKNTNIEFHEFSCIVVISENVRSMENYNEKKTWLTNSKQSSVRRNIM